MASKKINCWEFKQCGREPGGAREAELGSCPATVDVVADGLNSGTHGGRICWAVSGTFCGGAVQGSFATKRASCMSCEFYKQVRQEEPADRFRFLKFHHVKEGVAGRALGSVVFNKRIVSVVGWVGGWFLLLLLFFYLAKDLANLWPLYGLIVLPGVGWLVFGWFYVWWDKRRRAESEGVILDYIQRLVKHDFDAPFAFSSTLPMQGVASALQQMATESSEQFSAFEQSILDTTGELEETLSSLTAIIDNMADGLLVTGLDGSVILYNPRLLAMFNLQPKDLVNQKCHKIFGFVFVEFVQQSLDCSHLLSSAEIPLGRGRIAKAVSTSIMQASSQGRLMVDENDPFKCRGKVFLIRDITDHKQMVADLQVARDSAEEANRFKSEFLANMSHEIRTPMNAIVGMTDLVLASELTQTQQAQLKIVQSSSDELLALINNILDISKIEAGQIVLEQIDFNLHERIENTTEIMAIKAQHKGVELLSRIVSGVPERVMGDSHRLHQILLNLINNAIKFTDHGEIVLSVDVSADQDGDAGGVVLHFSVSDSGIGIPAERLEMIFGRFAQADGGTTRTYGGTGLGLAICKHLVELIGGRIWVESQEGEGSVFHFTARFDLMQAGAFGADSALSVMASPLAELRVLVGSSHDVGRLIVKEIVAGFGASVVEVVDVEGLLPALQVADQAGDPFDFLLLDHYLLLSESPLFAQLSGHSGWRGGVAALLPLAMSLDSLPPGNRLPGMGVIYKPFRRFDLLGVINRLLGRGFGSAVDEQEDALFLSLAAEPLAILLVDDKKVNQMVGIDILQRVGHVVSVVGNGSEALTSWEQRVFDLILIDLHMPEIDGYEVTRRIRQAERDEREESPIPIVAVTASVLAGEQDRCLQSGMNGFLAKPYRARELVTMVKQFGKRPQRSRSRSKGVAAPVLLDESLDLEQAAHGRRQFLAQMPPLLDELRQSVAKHDSRRVQKQVEQLKGLVTDAGAVLMKMLAVRFGTAILGENWEKAEQILTTLTEACQQTSVAIVEVKEGV